jgi:hypothetical protein
MTDPAMFAIAERLDGGGASVETILAELRKASPSIIESMKVVRDLRQWPMDRAKLAVHNSEAWRHTLALCASVRAAARYIERLPAVNSDTVFLC